MKLFGACFLGCCLFFQTVNVNAMGCLQFAKETAQKYIVGSIPLVIEVVSDFDVSPLIQTTVRERLESSISSRSMPINEFLGLLFEFLGDAINIQDRKLTVECYHQAANYGNVSAIVKWGQAVFIQYSQSLREYREGSFEKLQGIAESVEKNEIVVDPHLSVELFELLASCYAGKEAYEEAKKYFEKAKAIVSEKFDEDYKEQILEHIDSLMRNLEDL